MRMTSRPDSSNVGFWNLNDLGIFYARNKSLFLVVAKRFLGNEAIRAEEVVQEALLKVILAAPELESEDHAKAYIFRTIQNLCIDAFRAEGRRPDLVVLDDAMAEIEKASMNQDLDFDEIFSKAEDSAIVRQAISLLSAAERSALVMWEIEERSAREIAKELGIKESSVRHTVSRARASLRRILSSIVIDESRGLTGLDMLSRSYGRAKDLAKESSKVALSLLLVLVAFAGFSSLPADNLSVSTRDISSPASSNVSSVPTTSREESKSGIELGVSKTKAKIVKAEKPKLTFPGLNKSGLPIGFTIADSTGALGSAYFRERTVPSSSSYTSSSQIIKTESGAANIFISQTLSSEGNEVTYSPSVSFGKSGAWVPLLVDVDKSDFARLADRNYLLTAQITVQSEVDSPIRITAKANGRDLELAPSRLVIRLLLDSSKTMVLSQAVYVIESEQKA